MVLEINSPAKSISTQYVDDFVGELTFSNHLIKILCKMNPQAGNELQKIYPEWANKDLISKNVSRHKLEKVISLTKPST